MSAYLADARVLLWWLSDEPITGRHAREAARLALLHRDPFDRMIAAQALLEGMTLVTSDTKMAEYGAQVLW